MLHRQTAAGNASAEDSTRLHTDKFRTASDHPERLNKLCTRVIFKKRNT